MCNLYSVTKGQDAIRAFTLAMRDTTGNLPPMTGVFPDYAAPVVRNASDGVRDLAMLRWGMPSSKAALLESAKKRAAKLEAKGRTVDLKELLRVEPDSGTTNVRNTASAHWKRWLGVQNRCVVPFTSFSEFNKAAGGDIWFALDESRPLAFFAGIWTSWTSVRKVKEGETINDIFGFLTTEPNAEVAPIHPKAMPVILRTQAEVEGWLTMPPEKALILQRPLPDGSLKIVATGKSRIINKDLSASRTNMNTAHAYLDSLNSQQRSAVEHGVLERDTTPRAPLLVIAGAGSGKTNTLAHRVAHLVVQGADPRRILLMTFSRRASGEMTKRVEHIARRVISESAGTLMEGLTWAGTFHGIGARLLREYAEQIGLDPTFTIHDREDLADLMNLVRHDLGFSNTEKRFPTKATCLSIYSRCVNAEAELDKILAAAFPWCITWESELRQLFAGYVEAKQKQNVLDYDDLLLYWAQLANEPEFAADMAARFDHVLVDEYQDTNRLQASILLALKPNGHGLTVVGDDAQSIYSFRAATVRNILDFPASFNPVAEIITLDQNYRSTQPVLEAANGVIGLAAERFTKDLWTDRTASAKPRLVHVRDEADQAQYIADSVLENRETGSALKHQAVLFRSSHHSGPVEVELTRRNIPFIKFGGLKFLDTAHVKDILALLRFAQNPRDRVAGFRVLQLIPGVGPTSSQKILEEISSSPDPARALSKVSSPPRAGDEWPVFLEAFGCLTLAKFGWPAELERARGWYAPHLERIHEDAEIRQADLIQLEQIATGYPSREKFLTELTLDPPDATSDQAGVATRDEDYLILSTIHSAEGQEWKSVFVLNVVDGCIPSDLGVGSEPEVEEERRLLYVAMTRAKDDLHLVVPQRFFTHGQNARGDRHVYAQRTRFIPNSLIGLFEKTTWPAVTAEQGGAKPMHGPRVDIGARMRGMWR